MVNGQSGTFPNNDVVSKYRQLSIQKLIDTADYFYNHNEVDMALSCFILLINTASESSDIEDLKRVLRAYNGVVQIYSRTGNYRIAYEFALDALKLSERVDDVSHLPLLHSCIGYIFSCFNEYDLAELHCREGLKYSRDSIDIAGGLNDLGYVKLESGSLDSVLYFLKQSLDILKRHDATIQQAVLHSVAAYYEKTKVYDSAFLYYRLAFEIAEKYNRVNVKAITLSDWGKLFLLLNKPDSALYYVNLSNAVAAENNLLGTMTKNYLILSDIAESKGQKQAAYTYFRQHSNLKDSILNLGKISEINQLRSLYEASKVNRQIERFTIDQQMKERTIRYQFVILMLISIALISVFIQNRKLNTAYKKLFEKNIQISEFQQQQSKNEPERQRKSILTDEMQDDLIVQIYALMEDGSIVCDEDFTLDKLAKLLRTNRTYVSQAINDVLQKNFTHFTNEYRIKEAQRLFSEPDASKYTVEFVASKTGFKSRNTFSRAFKEITGVSPGFYLKSTQER
jgi:AraC-like DNA-binding protein